MAMSAQYLDDRLVDLTTQREQMENEVKVEGLTRDQKKKKLVMLARIGNAITRIHKETYGICVERECREEIPSDRLVKTPYAERCLACQSALEEKTRRAHA